MVLRVVRLASPVGPLVLVEGPSGLVALTWEGGWDATARAVHARFGDALLREEGGSRAGEKLGAWFDGDLSATDDLPVDTGGTTFQRQVWAGLRAIPRGEVRSYGELAVAVGHPRAARAIGGANRANPVAILIPCHRVIASDGSLGGYAGEWGARRTPISTGSGLERKLWLLRHEGVQIHEGRVVRRLPR